MLARCRSAALQGLEARPVIVEVDLAPGLPGIQLVGLPDKAIQESRERVRSALRNSGFRGPLVRRGTGARGSLRPCRGVLAMAEQACRHVAEALVVPPGNADEAALIDGLTVRTAPNLKQLVEQLNGTRPCLRIC